VRICGDELIEHGTTIDGGGVPGSSRQPATSIMNTSIGVATASLFMIEASMHIPPGYAMFIPSAIRKAVELPVVGVGRFKDPLQAERALAEGHCDLVGVVRGQIADADFAAKARAGATDEIRLCLSCNQECVGRMGLNRWLGCIENPRTGKEATDRLPPQGRGGRDGRWRRARRPAGGDRRGPGGARGDGLREAATRRRPGALGGVGAESRRVR
jgi:2,4-dienoyl-CoA reductase (NADPH2)